MIVPNGVATTAAHTKLNHIAIDTGHNRVSQRSEISPLTIDETAPWLEAALHDKGYVPIPGRPGYGVVARYLSGGIIVMVATVREGFEQPLCLLTFLTCDDPATAPEHWDLIKSLTKTPNKTEMPAVPWCAVAFAGGLSLETDFSWFGAFEKVCSWCWLE